MDKAIARKKQAPIVASQATTLSDLFDDDLLRTKR